MDRVISTFITCLRQAGLGISTSETLDALEAVRLVGYEDRAVFKDALSATLVKSAHEMDTFLRYFDRYFSLDPITDETMNAIGSLTKSPDESGAAADVSLVDMPAMKNKTALLLALQKAAQEVRLEDIRYITQRNPYVTKMLDAMGMRDMELLIGSLKAEGTAAASGRAAALERAVTSLKESTRWYVDRQMALNMSSAAVSRTDPTLRHRKLSTLEERDLKEIEAIIRRMVKRLRDRQSRSRTSAHRGQLDFKKTLRKNMARHGFLFDTQWKKKKIDRPELVVICDISKSVMRTVRFLLMFIYGLNQIVSRIRTFALCSNLVEVTSVLDRLPLEEAIEKIRLGEGLPIFMGYTDYNQSFLDFRDMFMDSVSRKTTVIILGDARNNYQEAQTAVLRTIHERSKRLIWLNPEDESFWGSGDSEMKQYIPCCSMVQECNTLHHLEEFVRKTISI
ncbi:MAG: VWA domain-containing protein [Syntrophales bacterium]|jgi:uncharacterized protein with von Willebrand factor type A (vWA) domain|nr:VWA domain-containing protein [Syntrophales bacterium]MCK9528351.1 VWA domain-containing protein [Syntrophales bacterium]MDX9922724.1 VWA domain-containing protein [Syntrophales bacterium]